MKAKNKLFYITKDRSVLDIFDSAILNFFDEVLRYMDDDSCFRECCSELIHNYADYDFSDSDIWELYQAVFYPSDTITMDLLVEKLSDFYYSLLNNHRIDTCEYPEDYEHDAF